MRSALVVAVPWFAYWGIQYRDAATSVTGYEASIGYPDTTQEELYKQIPDMPEKERAGFLTEINYKHQRLRADAEESMPYAQDRRDDALVKLIAYPFGAIVIFLALLFICRGFASTRTRTKSDPLVEK